MTPQFLLDTHILIRWLSEPKKLSREQFRALEDVVRRGEYVCVSGFSLLEIALLGERRRITAGLNELFHELDTNPSIRILSLTTDVVREVSALGDALRDPADRVIVATARIHRLRLVTADQRIIASKLVGVIE
uniref:PilT protein domain protein n=1 Tax=Solibacter usitatus (strain Ellin6076) TaxID=234267 RepID=Q025D0_SOLUE